MPAKDLSFTRKTYKDVWRNKMPNAQRFKG